MRPGLRARGIDPSCRAGGILRVRFGVVEVERVRRHVAGVIRRSCRDARRKSARRAEYQARTIPQAVIRARDDAR